jgi:hypothetical protein
MADTVEERVQTKQWDDGKTYKVRFWAPRQEADVLSRQEADVLSRQEADGLPHTQRRRVSAVIVCSWYLILKS